MLRLCQHHKSPSGCLTGLSSNLLIVPSTFLLNLRKFRDLTGNKPLELDLLLDLDFDFLCAEGLAVVLLVVGVVALEIDVVIDVDVVALEIEVVVGVDKTTVTSGGLTCGMGGAMSAKGVSAKKLLVSLPLDLGVASSGVSES